MQVITGEGVKMGNVNVVCVYMYVGGMGLVGDGENWKVKGSYR